MDASPTRRSTSAWRGALALAGALVALVCVTGMPGGGDSGSAASASDMARSQAASLTIERLAGATRVETAITVSERTHPATGIRR